MAIAGGRHVDELLTVLSPEQVDELVAFHELEPFGPRATGRPLADLLNVILSYLHDPDGDDPPTSDEILRAWNFDVPEREAEIDHDLEAEATFANVCAAFGVSA